MMTQTMTATSLTSVVDRISRRNRMSLANGLLANSFSAIQADAQIDPALAQDGRRFID
jgi:hypothetical protein